MAAQEIAPANALPELVDVKHDTKLMVDRRDARDRCFQYNQMLPQRLVAHQQFLSEFLGAVGDDVTILAPFHCDYGYQVTVGERFFAYHNLVVLDLAPVKIGDDVQIGPNCTITTVSRPLSQSYRQAGFVEASPVTIGNQVAIGPNVVINPGVTIGDGATIEAGTVVSIDVPAGAVMAGNPGQLAASFLLPE